MGFTLEDLARNLLVAGVVGSGKTTLVKRILSESSGLGVGFLVYDWEGEYRDMVRLADARVFSWHEVGLDLWRPPEGMVWGDYVYYVAGVLVDYVRARGWEVSPRMTVAVREAVEYCVRLRATGAQCFRDGLARAGLRLGSQTVLAVEARLGFLLDGVVERVSGGVDVLSGALGERLIVDLSGLARLSRQAARAFIELGLARLRARVLARRPVYDRADYLVVLEEAEEVLRPRPWGESPLLSDLAHYRKRGVGIILVAHSVTGLGREVLQYIGNYAVFNTGGAGDPGLQRILGSSPDLDPSLLDKGEAVIKTFTRPLPVKTHIEPPRRAPSSARRALLESLRERPLLTQRERRALLGLDGSTYKRLVEELLASGEVELVEVYTGGPGRPPRILALKGRNPSVLHEYGVARAREILSGRCRVEVNGAEGPDLTVECDGVRIAVEVETGSNLVREKLRKRLQAYDGLVVVCVTRECARRARRIVESLGERAAATTLYRLGGVVARLIERAGKR